MEAKRKKSFSKQGQTKVRAPVIHRQPVSLGTEVPMKPRPEELLEAPDEQAFRIKMSEICKQIKHLSRRLADKSEAPRSPALSPSELAEKVEQLQKDKMALHEQRILVEDKHKALNREILKDPNYQKLSKAKKKVTLNQLKFRKEKILKAITVLTLTPAEDTKRTNEVKLIDQVIPLVEKMEERDRLDKQKTGLWNRIEEIKGEITKLDEQRKQEHVEEQKGSAPQEEDKGTAVLRKKLSDLQGQKQMLQFEFNAKVDEYNEQLSQIKTAEWIARKKELLLKIRAKEGAAIKADKEKCDKLIESCNKVAQKYSLINAPEESKALDHPESKFKDKEKKKKRRQKKKAEILIGALDLDTLRQQFEYFSIAVPKCKEDLGKAIEQLQLKRHEIANRHLTETIGYGSADSDSDTLSVSSLSLSPQTRSCNHSLL